MKNNWEYSTLNRAEKMKRIASGDITLYKSERENTRRYKDELSKAGVSTERADSYQNELDNALASYEGSQNTERDGTVASRSSQFLGQMYDKLIELENQYGTAMKKLKEEYDGSIGALSEWIANNGYSLDGDFGKSKLDDVHKLYKKAIKDLKDEYVNATSDKKRMLGIRSRHDFTSR